MAILRERLTYRSSVSSKKVATGRYMHNKHYIWHATRCAKKSIFDWCHGLVISKRSARRAKMDKYRPSKCITTKTLTLNFYMRFAAQTLFIFIFVIVPYFHCYQSITGRILENRK